MMDHHSLKIFFQITDPGHHVFYASMLDPIDSLKLPGNQLGIGENFQLFSAQLASLFQGSYQGAVFGNRVCRLPDMLEKFDETFSAVFSDADAIACGSGIAPRRPVNINFQSFQAGAVWVWGDEK